MANAGNHRALRFINYIGRIFGPTNSALKHHILTALSPELQKSDHGDDLKKSAVNLVLLNYVTYRLKMFNDMLFADHLAVDLDALAECVNVGRGKHSRLET